jgi:predicted DCC family thiol-disulfide oxidoreductase YuxK
LLLLIVPPGKWIVLFDGVCNLCNRSVQFIIRHDHKGKFLFAALQSEAGQALLKQHNLPLHTNPESIVLLHDRQIYQYSGAALRIARNLGGIWSLAYGFIILPPFIRDGIYKLIARNRYRWFGRQDSCMLPTAALKAKFL